MRTRIIWAAVAASALVLTLAASAVAKPSTVKSNFTLDNDGWGWLQDANGESLFVPTNWSPTGGDPGGFISGADNDAGSGEQTATLISFDGRFAGDFSAYYGGKIKLDLMDNKDGTKPVKLVWGSSDGSKGKAFFAKAKPAPGPDWRSYSVPLVAKHWQYLNYSGTTEGPLKPATKKVMKSTMAKLITVEVYADYSHADSEVVSLDNYAWVPPKN